MYVDITFQDGSTLKHSNYKEIISLENYFPENQ